VYLVVAVLFLLGKIPGISFVANTSGKIIIIENPTTQNIVFCVNHVMEDIRRRFFSFVLLTCRA